MIIRTLFFYLNYLYLRIRYRKQIWFRGFSVICALKGSEIQFNNSCGGDCLKTHSSQNVS